MSLLAQKLQETAEGKGIALSFLPLRFPRSHFRPLGPTELDKQIREEARILEEYKDSVPLLSVSERAQGITFTSTPLTF